jgi:very-short-patch-repair endonuclease
MSTPLGQPDTHDGAGCENRTLGRHERERALLGIASHQDALLCLVQAQALGFSKWAVRRRVESGLWGEVLPGVYRVTGAPITDRQRVRAAQLWAGGSAVVSHLSAGWLWGFDGVRPPSRPEVTVPRRRGPSSELVVVHRSLVLPEVDRGEVAGLPVTSAARTVVDLAGVIDGESLETALESGLRLGLFRESLLRWRVQELGGPGRPGSGELRHVLEQRGKSAAPLGSRLEVKAWRLLIRSDLPRPVRQHHVRLNGRSYYIDFAWPQRRVALECDGYEPHRGRIAFRRDRRKLAALASAQWLVIPATWEDITRRPKAKLSELRSAFSTAA